MNGQRPFFPGKPRYPFRNNYNNQKVPFHERNGNADYDERQNNRRSTNSNNSNHAANNGGGGVYSSHYRRSGNEDSRFVYVLFFLTNKILI